MIDEKRIKRFIEGAKKAFKEVDDPTFTFPMNILSANELATSIEELLKAQEPVKPIIRPEMDDICSCIDNVAYCGKCGAQIGRLKQNYCSNCGQAVKWA